MQLCVARISWDPWEQMVLDFLGDCKLQCLWQWPPKNILLLFRSISRKFRFSKNGNYMLSTADLTVLIIDQKFVSLPLSYSEHCVQFQPVDCWLEETFLPLNQNKSMELAGELKRNKISRVIYAGQWHGPACALHEFKDEPWPNSQVSLEDLV